MIAPVVGLREAPLSSDSTSRELCRLRSQGGVWLALYERSLGIALGLLFLLSFVLHWLGTWRASNQEAALHGERLKSFLETLGEAGFWFESFQNWQSEFLSTAALVVLSIMLRQRNSPESKPVEASHAKTGA